MKRCQARSSYLPPVLQLQGGVSITICPHWGLAPGEQSMRRCLPSAPSRQPLILPPVLAHGQLSLHLHHRNSHQKIQSYCCRSTENNGQYHYSWFFLWLNRNQSDKNWVDNNKEEQRLCVLSLLSKKRKHVYTKTTNSLCYVDSERLRDNVHVNPADETSSLMTDTDNNNMELSSPSCPGPGQV